MVVPPASHKFCTWSLVEKLRLLETLNTLEGYKGANYQPAAPRRGWMKVCAAGQPSGWSESMTGQWPSEMNMTQECDGVDCCGTEVVTEKRKG